MSLSCFSLSISRASADFWSVDLSEERLWKELTKASAFWRPLSPMDFISYVTSVTHSSIVVGKPTTLSLSASNCGSL
eukprot:263269-Amphidinium_carterae.1